MPRSMIASSPSSVEVNGDRAVLVSGGERGEYASRDGEWLYDWGSAAE